LAILAKKLGSWRGKMAANEESSISYKLSIVSLEKQMAIFDKFMKFWDPKLHKWDSFIEELHEAEFASEEEGRRSKRENADH
jgi:hypothetical protein